MRLITTIGSAALLLLFAIPAFAGEDPALDELLKKTPEELKVGIENQHPVVYYLLAGKLFEKEKKDEAVFWYYAGQLRYRFLLAAHPELDPTKDKAVFGSVSKQIGTPINEWAFGDLPALEKTLAEVAAWDEKTPNGFTSKTDYAVSWKETRDGMAKLVEYIRTNGDQIRAQRAAAGLENRH